MKPVDDIGGEPLDGLGMDPVWAGSASTRRNYEISWRSFTSWCDRHELVALPATSPTVAAYIADLADRVDEQGQRVYAASTIVSRTPAIDARHRMAGLPPPGASKIVRDALAGLRGRPEATRQMAPVLLADLKRALASIDTDSFPAATIGHRDRAILLLGFVGAFRRSELASRRIGDIILRSDEGVLIRRGASTSDIEDQYKRLPVGVDPRWCPPCAVARWLTVLTAADSCGGRTDNMASVGDMSSHVCNDQSVGANNLDPHAFLFRTVRRGGHVGRAVMSPDVVSDVVKRRLAAVGLDPRRFGSDSLHTGFIAQAMLDGATSVEIREQTGHRNAAYLERYRGRLPHGNAVSRLQL